MQVNQMNKTSSMVPRINQSIGARSGKIEQVKLNPKVAIPATLSPIEGAKPAEQPPAKSIFAQKKDLNPDQILQRLEDKEKKLQKILKKQQDERMKMVKYKAEKNEEKHRKA